MRDLRFSVLKCTFRAPSVFSDNFNRKTWMLLSWIGLTFSLLGSNGSGERPAAKQWGKKSMATILTAKELSALGSNFEIPVGWQVVADDSDSIEIVSESSTAESPQTPLNERVTLADAYNRYRLPILQQEQRKPATIAEYQTALNAWLRFWNPEKRFKNETTLSVLGTDAPNKPEPSIEQITGDDLAEFRAWYASGKRGKLQVNKVVTNVGSILLAAAERNKIAAPPKIKKLSTNKAAPKVYLSYDHINAIYEACETANWPVKDRNHNELSLPAAIYWKTAIVMFFNYGFRTQELIAFEKGHRALSWNNIEFGIESPNSDVTNANGWLWYTPQKQEHCKPEPLVLPLNAITRKHLQLIYRGKRSDQTLLFPFAHDPDKFYETWHSIVDAAGVKPKSAMSTTGNRYLIKHFRKTCSTWHNFFCRGIAPFVIGHADRDSTSVAMTNEHYDNAELALVKAFEEFEQPASFNQINSDQLHLF